MNQKDIYENIVKLIHTETKYNRFYDGVVVKLGQSKATCAIPALGWDTEEKGAVCTYSDKNSLTNLKLNDQVIIGFRDNNPARAFIIGLANDFEGMSATSYNFEGKIETIFEDREGNIKITKDEINKEFKITVGVGWKIIMDNIVNNFTMNSTSVNINNGNHEVLP
jgi:hypothetical protein